jgi:hypothetical protein
VSDTQLLAASIMRNPFVYSIAFGGVVHYLQTTMDYTGWYNSARQGESGYKTTDINMDGVVTTMDYTQWYNNAWLGAASTVP